jgi:hypothetical protein
MIVNTCYCPRISGTFKNEEDIMKYRLNLKKLAAGIAIITSFLILGCDLSFGSLQDPEELFEKKGAVVITNISNTKPVKKITVTDVNTKTKDEYKSDANGGIISANATLSVVLDPGTYEFDVDYGEDENGEKIVGPSPKTFQIVERKRESWYVAGESTQPEPRGILQIINWSGKPVTSIKIGGEEKLPDTIIDRESFSVLLVPGTYEVTVDVPEIGSPFPITKSDVEIKLETVTTIIVFPDGLEVGVLDPATYNLWVLNRATKDIEKVEKKNSNDAGYSPLILNKDFPITKKTGFAGTILPNGEYNIQVILGKENQVTLNQDATLSNDPVFIIVKDGANGPEIELISNGDRDKDGFPDWWEDLYFGPEAAGNADVPGKEGDADNDGVNNWDEFIDGTNPIKEDTDQDGLWDVEEKTGMRHTTILKEQRPSGIQIPDTFDPTDPLKQDTDGDGYTDYLELIKGTDPLDPLSYPQSDPSGTPGGITIIVKW